MHTNVSQMGTTLCENLCLYLWNLWLKKSFVKICALIRTICG